MLREKRGSTIAKGDALEAKLAERDAKPKNPNLGRPMGATDLKPRKQRGSASLGVGQMSKLRHSGYRVSQQNDVSKLGSYAITDTKFNSLVNALGETSNAVASLASLYNNLSPELKTQFKGEVLRRQGRTPQASGVYLDTTDKGQRAILNKRTVGMAQVAGGDLESQLIHTLSQDNDLLHTVVAGITLRLKEHSVFELLGLEPISACEALLLKMECRMSDPAYIMLRKLLPKGQLPSLKPVKDSAFALTPGVMKLQGSNDGAMLESPFSAIMSDARLLLNRTVRHPPPHKTTYSKHINIFYYKTCLKLIAHSSIWLA
jgi:hypothetical protein